MNSFDDIIKQKADDHEAPVPASAWDNIIKKKKKRRIVFFWLILAMLFISLGIGGYFNYSNNKNNEPVIIAKNEKEVTENNTVSSQKPSEKETRKENIEESLNDKNKPAVNKDDRDQVNDEELKNINSSDNKTKKEITDSKIIDQPLQTNKSRNTSINFNNTIVSNKKKTNPVADKNYINSGSDNKNENTDTLFAKNKQVKKQQPKTRVNIKTPGIESTVTGETVKNNDETINNKIIKREEIKNSSDDNKKEADQSSQLKKDLAADSISKKDVATAPVENKKEKRPGNKRSKQHPWFIDAAVSPVFPIQQYDRSVSFSRSSVSNNELSEFSGKLVNTSIDPSIAFAIALRKKLGKKITVGTGLQYVQLKENIHIAGTQKNTITTIVDKLVDGATGPMLVRDTIQTITEGNRDISATNSYSFLSIPVFVQYNFIQTRSWSLDVIAGTYITINSRYKNEINRNATALLVSSSQSTNKNNISMAIYGGIRIGKMLSKRFELFGIPSMSWNPRQQNIKNSMIDKKIQQAGVSFGLSYRLN